MRKHPLMDPAFPDVVGAWALSEQTGVGRGRGGCVNREEPGSVTDLSDPLFELLARIDIADTRLW